MGQNRAGRPAEANSQSEESVSTFFPEDYVRLNYFPCLSGANFQFFARQKVQVPPEHRMGLCTERLRGRGKNVA